MVYQLRITQHLMPFVTYSFEEVRDTCNNVLDRFGTLKDENIWTAWKKKLESIDSSWLLQKFHIKKKQGSQTMDDAEYNDKDGMQDKVVSACPINIPAIRNNHLPTEDQLRQTIGTSLSPQNLALQLIADGLDAWGDSFVVEQVPIIDEGYIDEKILAESNLLPATGFLLVGSEGVGKFHIARRLAKLLLEHCSEPSSISDVPNNGDTSSKQDLEGLLVINAVDYEDLFQSAIMELLVNHIHSRDGLGSVIIIHHIESLPAQVIHEIAQVVNGESSTLSYGTSDDKLVETSCNGTVFIMTSRQWGTNSLFQHIEQYNGSKGLHRNRESLIYSIRDEVDSHLDSSNKFASVSVYCHVLCIFKIMCQLTLNFHLSFIVFNLSHPIQRVTVAPVLPLQREDLSSILQGRIQDINLQYQGMHWKRLVVSLAAIRLSIDSIDFLDIHPTGGRGDDMLTYASHGAHALNNNALWQTLSTGIVVTERRRPGLIL